MDKLLFNCVGKSLCGVASRESQAGRATVATAVMAFLKLAGVLIVASRHWQCRGTAGARLMNSYFMYICSSH